MWYIINYYTVVLLYHESGGVTVAADMLNKILEAEKESEKALADASLEAEKIVSDAKLKQEQIVKDAEKEASDEMKKAHAFAASENAQLLEKTRKEASEFSAELLKNAQNSKKECINIVIDKIFG